MMCLIVFNTDKYSFIFLIIAYHTITRTQTHSEAHGVYDEDGMIRQWMICDQSSPQPSALILSYNYNEEQMVATVAHVCISTME